MPRSGRGCPEQPRTPAPITSKATGGGSSWVPLLVIGAILADASSALFLAAAGEAEGGQAEGGEGKGGGFRHRTSALRLRTPASDKEEHRREMTGTAAEYEQMPDTMRVQPALVVRVEDDTDGVQQTASCEPKHAGQAERLRQRHNGH